jgi:hypothetical protein
MRLGAVLGAEFVLAVLTNKEREITLERGLDRSERRRGSGRQELNRKRDMERRR